MKLKVRDSVFKIKIKLAVLEEIYIESEEKFIKLFCVKSCGSMDSIFISKESNITLVLDDGKEVDIKKYILTSQKVINKWDLRVIGVNEK